MDLAFTKEEIAFREEVREFFKNNVPPETRRKLQEGRHLSKDEMVTWWRILNKKGWGVTHWPKEHGGTGWTTVQHYIFNEELQSYPAPQPLAFGVFLIQQDRDDAADAQMGDHFLGAAKTGGDDRPAAGLDSGQQAALVMAVGLRAVDRAGLHPPRPQDGTHRLPLAEMAGHDDRALAGGPRGIERVQTGTGDGEPAQAGGKFGPVINLEQGLAHVAAHVAAERHPRVARHIGKDPQQFTVESAARGGKPPHRPADHLAERTRASLKGTPPRIDERRPQREIPDMLPG